MLLPSGCLHHRGDGGEDSSAMTRDCLESGSVFLIFGSSVVLGVPVSAGARAVDTVDDFFADLDIEILRSVQKGIVAAPPKPHLGDQAGGAGSPERVQRSGLATVPLHLRRKASPFWIILLLVGARSEHPMIHPAAPDRSAIALANVRFSNRPFGVKRFQTIHQHSVDVAHGLVLLFGIGAKALPSWDSKTRRNNLWDGLAVSVTAGPSGHTISPHPSSREGHHSTAQWNSSFLLLD